MEKRINCLYLDVTPYDLSLEMQKQIFNAQLEKLEKGNPTSNTLIFLQHSPVYTLGKSGDIKNLKVPIEDTGAEYFQTDRGGDITYHGPGQLTGYPIFNLKEFDIGVREFVYRIEQCVIDCMASYGIKCDRIEEASGVWVSADTKMPRKICAIGIKVSKGISMHGFALNINTNLSYFENIVPCGLEDTAVTSLQKELGREVDFIEVCENLEHYFFKHFS
jgi:lipoyl(octanoyl) transferase